MAKKKLSYKEERFISYCEQYYFQKNAGFPSPKEAADALNYTETDINYFLGQKHVQQSLERRGLPWRFTNSNVLTPVQTAAAFTVMNFADKRPIDEKLDELGVAPTLYYSWLNNPYFNEFVNTLGDQNMTNVRHEAITEFTKLVRSGDLQAIKYYFEITGQHKPPEAVNIEVIVTRLIEAVQKHVKDPATLQAISTEFMGVAPMIEGAKHTNSLKGG